jgi:hypothetical protein
MQPLSGDLSVEDGEYVVHLSNIIPKRRSPSTLWLFGFPVAIIMVLYYSSAGSRSSINTRSQTSLKKLKSSETEALELSVTVANDYGDYMSNMFPYPFLEGALLLEPYTQTTFTIEGFNDGCAYEWSILGELEEDFGKGGITTTDTFVSKVDGPARYRLSIQESCPLPVVESDGGIAVNSTAASEWRSYTSVIWCKYVRRELSSLTDSDRNEFLAAFHTLWTVNTVDGRALYGDRYKSLQYLATIHNDGGGNPVCDEFHGDVGFVNNHVYLGMYLEQSLQLVNPKVALHYMDYSMYFDSEQFDERTSTELSLVNWTTFNHIRY